MPDAFAHLLRRLMDDGCVAHSQFSARSFKELGSLFDAGVLCLARSGGGRVVKVENHESLAAFYRDRYPCAEGTVMGPPRACAVATLRSAKRTGRTDMEPVLLRAMSPVVGGREGAECDLHAVTRLTGAACLVLERGRFWSLRAEIAIIENLECFLYFERMAVTADMALYAAGRLSDFVLAWLRSPEMAGCRYLHCGDWDPVGLDEYLRLKRAVGGRARLHVPPDLEELTARYGRPELLRDSGRVLARLRREPDSDIRGVIDVLDRTGRGLEQEIMLLTTAQAAPRVQPRNKR